MTDRHDGLRPGDTWDEDYGDVLWCSLPIDEPPYLGIPGDDGFPWASTPLADLWWAPLPPPWSVAAKDERIAELRAALEKVESVGHNEDCIFCGFKDRAAREAREATR